LPAVPPPAVLDGLCRHAWILQDDFDLFMTPQILRFDSSLHCELEFRAGECRQSGRFSIERDQIVFEVPDPGCDARGGVNLFRGRTVGVAIVGDTLTLDARRYVPSEGRNPLRRAGGFGNSGDLYLGIACQGELEAGRPTLLTLTYEYVSRSSRPGRARLMEMRAALQPLAVVDNALRDEGESQGCARRVYGQSEIVTGAPFADTLTVVPRVRGTYVRLDFEWDYEDRGQVYHSMARPVVRVR
jgi:hypothetical protein